MYFRMLDAAKSWFRPIRGELEYDFDGYYFCAILGMAAARKQDAQTDEAYDLVENFPGKYRDRARMIIAAFLRREVELRDVPLTNRAMLDATLRELLSPISASHLSDRAVQEMNRYANGGFFYLQEQFDEPPQSLQAFLLMYRQILHEALSARA